MGLSTHPEQRGRWECHLSMTQRMKNQPYWVMVKEMLNALLDA
jgi:hypothetical protein